jgi:hypothetical protein
MENNEMDGTCSRVEGGDGMYRDLVGKLEGKRQLGRLRCRWENNNKCSYLQKVGCGGMDWIKLI